MALTAQQVYDAVWKTDQIAAPVTAPDRASNETWQPQSWVKDTGNRVRALEAELSAVRAIAAANNAALKDVRAQLDALTATLAQLDVSGALGALQAAINATTITLHTGEVTS
ncbi:hypothetical protein [Streptomyces sp. KR55]|uniref:hypothetical protein n=1 Tax=Streptomyces sp. KR55 TaxID=3457425 RepID=UPI003FD11B1A